MRKSVLSAAVAAALTVPTLAAAQTPAPAPAPTPSPFTGNIALVSDYRFRGITQTFEEPALQGGFDYAHASGIYLGNWNSNVSQGAGFPGGNLEMDFYGGWKKAFGDFGLDVGFIYYYYPGTDSPGPTGIGAPTNFATGAVASGKVDNKEIYIGGTWKFLSLKYFWAIDDYFSIPGTKNSNYIDLSGTWDFGGGWGLVGHYGHLDVKNFGDASYNDWKLGVTKDLSGWVFGLTYVDTDAKGGCGAPAQPYCFFNTSGSETKDAGKSTVVFSISKTF
jgi:uncharacterized protein (TIGR02001 family)